MDPAWLRKPVEKPAEKLAEKPALSGERIVAPGLFQRKQHPLFRTSSAVVGAKPALDRSRQAWRGRDNFFTESFRGGTRNDPISRVYMPRESSITVQNQTSLVSQRFDENQSHPYVQRASLRSFQKKWYGQDTVLNR